MQIGQRTMPHTDEEMLRASVRCASLISGVILFGTLGFHWIEPDWSLWKSMYFTLITVTTVGYGDFNLSIPGQQFASLLILAGIGVMTYSLTTLVHLAVDHDYQRRRRMKRQIDALHDHIIICGYGRMGRTTCEQLAPTGISFVVIESNDTNYDRAVDDGHLAIKGIASRDETLIKAGITRARGIVCAVDSDAENMYVVVSAKALTEDCLILSRADSEDAIHKLQRAGATFVISPLQMAGRSIAHALTGCPVRRKSDPSVKRVSAVAGQRPPLHPDFEGELGEEQLVDSLAAMAEAMSCDANTDDNGFGPGIVVSPSGSVTADRSESTQPESAPITTS